MNCPWGLALSPPEFGVAAILVGKFGDGRISAFDPAAGTFLGPLLNHLSQPITIDGLWGLIFGNGGNGGAAETLYFTAGLNDEADGLFGSLQVLPPAPATAPAMDRLGLAGLVGALAAVGIRWVRKHEQATS